MAAGFAGSKHRVEAVDGWLLHSYPYKETSLIIEVFSHDHGRVSLVARGARRPMSALRGCLMAFQPLSLSWFGSNELRTLHAAEWQGGVPQLSGLPLICGFYLNELLLKLLPHDDPHERLFDAYGQAIRGLATPRCEVEPMLRTFELALIRELGYGFALDQDANGHPIQRDMRYHYMSERGLLPIGDRGQGGEAGLSGATLLNMAAGRFDDAQTASQAKQLMRTLLGGLLGDTPLHTRKLLRDLHRL